VTTLGIGVRLWLWAGMIRVLKPLVPIGTLVRLARTPGPGSNRSKRGQAPIPGSNRSDRGQAQIGPGSGPDRSARLRRAERFEARLRAYLESRRRFPFRAPANCLERSLGAYRLLCGAAAGPELVVGVRRSPARGVEGHVWVTARGRVLAERPEDLAMFTTIVTFDAGGRQRTAAGFEGALPEIRVP
jgi:hypothetical protein